VNVPEYLKSFQNIEDDTDLAYSKLLWAVLISVVLPLLVCFVCGCLVVSKKR